MNSNIQKPLFMKEKCVELLRASSVAVSTALLLSAVSGLGDLTTGNVWASFEAIFAVVLPITGGKFAPAVMATSSGCWIVSAVSSASWLDFLLSLSSNGAT